MVEPVSRRRALPHCIFHALPIPPRAASPAANAPLGLLERVEAEVRHMPCLFEMASGEQSLHAVELIECERVSVPVRREDSHREVPARDVALELVLRHHAHAHQLRVGQLHGRCGIVPAPYGLVALRKIGIRAGVWFVALLVVRDERHECIVLFRVADGDARFVDVASVRREGICAAIWHLIPGAHDNATSRVPVRRIVEANSKTLWSDARESLPNGYDVSA